MRLLISVAKYIEMFENWVRLTSAYQIRVKSLKIEWDYHHRTKVNQKVWKKGHGKVSKLSEIKISAAKQIQKFENWLRIILA